MELRLVETVVSQCEDPEVRAAPTGLHLELPHQAVQVHPVQEGGVQVLQVVVHIVGLPLDLPEELHHVAALVGDGVRPPVQAQVGL